MVSMSFLSTLASAVYAVLPEQVRCPLPRRSEGVREFDAFLAGPGRCLPRTAAPLTRAASSAVVPPPPRSLARH
jgi:hypothetical protein